MSAALAALSVQTKIVLLVLAAILAQAQLLRRRAARAGVPDDDPMVSGLEGIVATVRRATDDVEELLDASRLQVGQALELHRTPTDLLELARQAIESQRVLASVPISLEADTEQLVGCWDARRLLRVLSNLLDNAVKYSPDGGQVTLTIRREEDHGQPLALLAVRDQGIGIPAADLPHVFEWFRRAGSVGSIRGAGIGLASIAEVVRQHGGTLEVASREGAGSTFTVRLPLYTATAAPSGGDSRCRQSA